MTTIVLKTFRDNYKMLQSSIESGIVTGYDKLSDVPNVRNLLELLCNTDAKDWDSITHHFL